MGEGVGKYSLTGKRISQASVCVFSSRIIKQQKKLKKKTYTVQYVDAYYEIEGQS